MKVYPVNALEISKARTKELAPHSKIEDAWNGYMDYQADFKSNFVEIRFTWDEGIYIRGVSMNSFIIANTNAYRGSVACYYRAFNLKDTIFSADFAIDNHIKIFTNKDKYNRTVTSLCDTVILKLYGMSNIKIGYLFIGEEWELPRFTINPARQTQLRNNHSRTFSGQVTGIPQETLRSFNANFERVEQEQFKVIDDYANGVQTIIPHVIDPYHEAHKDFSPMYATLVDFSDQEKRDENGFYWNYSMAWQEAK